MSDPKPVRRVSASRLATIENCTMLYYLSEIVGLPEKKWGKTAVGSCVHSILELLRRDKNRALHDLVKEAKTIYTSPTLDRLVRLWVHREKIIPKLAADIDGLCMIGINDTDFLDLDADKRFEPEHEFKLTLPNGAVLKGFIDRFARYGDMFRLHDYKTAGKKKTKAEIEDNYQSLCYQLYVWLTHGMLAEVRYYYLRFPPSKRYPANHVMITMPATETQLKGFALYVQHMWKVINSFTINEAKSGYCKDEGFCDRVCSFRKPFRYMVVTKKDGTQVKHWIDPKTGDLPYEAQSGESVEIMSHPGCPRFNRQ